MKHMSREEYMEKVNTFFPDDDDSSIEKIDFFSKFYDDSEQELLENGAEEVEKKWRKKFRDRFFEGGSKVDDPNEPTQKREFTEIFKEG